MQKQPRYQIQKMSMQMFDLLNLPTERIMRRAGLPLDFIEHDPRGVTAAQFFDVWQAVDDETQGRDVPMQMARLVAKGPFAPALFAFSCSPNIVVGLERLAVFKPLVAPIRLSVTHLDGAVRFEFSTSDPAFLMPDTMVAFELVYFLEICRNFTGVDIVPDAVHMPVLRDDQSNYDRFFGRRALVGRAPGLTLSREDAYRPLISENPQLWAGFERELTKQLAEQKRNTPMALRVRNALLELLPAGQASVDAVCNRLLTSRRSLQRHLSAEGETFQKVLDATRSDLSLHYLKRGDMSVEEISYLLAYRDPNSFYRAFHGWTGLTPSQARLEEA
ncbi:MAG: AraC family transcriptional regulator ligand-binding domain-containing protein [Shimia sp.]|jgi:AraC-like DNA-binding protein|uniref:AraC family transcriptional regulator ligand-binding domain-containing protein n=1 Tax=Shimia sp. TaxID=1954381 RepID=UPI0040599E97